MSLVAPVVGRGLVTGRALSTGIYKRLTHPFFIVYDRPANIISSKGPTDDTQSIERSYENYLPE